MLIIFYQGVLTGSTSGQYPQFHGILAVLIRGTMITGCTLYSMAEGDSDLPVLASRNYFAPIHACLHLCSVGSATCIRPFDNELSLRLEDFSI